MRQTVRIIVTDEEGNKTAEEHKVEDLKFKPRKKKKPAHPDKEDKELEALEALEKEEGRSKLNDD